LYDQVVTETVMHWCVLTALCVIPLGQVIAREEVTVLGTTALVAVQMGMGLCHEPTLVAYFQDVYSVT